MRGAHFHSRVPRGSHPRRSGCGRALALALACLLLAAPARADTVRDEFNAVSYSGNDGDHAWDGPWQEMGESNGPTQPYIHVVGSSYCAEGNCLQLGADWSFFFDGRWVARAADLDGTIHATLRFDYWRRGSWGDIAVFASTNGGYTWSTLADLSWSGSDTQLQHAEIDLSDYASEHTIICFGGRANSSYGGGIYLDNVEIDYLAPTASNDLAVVKTVDDPEPAEGETVTFTVTVGNSGPQMAGHVVVADALPAGLSFVSADATDGAYDVGAGLWELGDLAGPDFAQLEIVARADPGTAEQVLVNAAALAEYDHPNNDGTNDSDEAAVTVRAAASHRMLLDTGAYVGNGAHGRPIAGLGFQPDVVIVKADRDEGAVCRTASMEGEIVKHFTGGFTVQGNRILAFTEDGFTVGDDSDVNHAGDDYYWIAFKAYPGEMAYGSYWGNGGDDHAIDGLGFAPDYVLVLGEGDSEVWQRSALMTGDTSLPFEGDPASNRIQSLGADGFTVGDDDEVNRPGTLYHYVTWRELPGRLELGSYTGNGQDNRRFEGQPCHPQWVLTKQNGGKRGMHRTESLAGDATLNFTARDNEDDAFQALLPDGFELGKRGEVNESGRTFYFAAFSGDQPADLALAKTVDRPVAQEGEAVVFTITVRNEGPGWAGGVVAADTLPAGLEFVSSGGSQGLYDSGSGLWDVGALAVGAEAVLEITAQVAAGAGGDSLVNTARIAALDQDDPAAGNDADSAVVVVPSADLSLTKDVDDPAPRVGDLVTFTLAVANAGPDSAFAVTVADTLPAALAFESATPSQGAYDPDTGLWDLGDLAPDSAATLLLAATVDAGAAGAAITNAAAAAAESPSDSDPDNNSAAADLLVQAADLAVDKTVDEPTPSEGEQVTFQVVLSNLGPDAAAGVQLRDSLPAGLTFVSAAASHGAYDAGTWIWDLGGLAAGAADTLKITASVDAGTQGTTLVNTASVLATDQGDPDPDNDADVAEIGVSGTDLALAKVVDEEHPAEGDTLRFTITVDNLGPDDAAGIVVADTLPAGLAFAAAAASQGDYDAGTGLWTLGGLADGAAADLEITAVVAAGAAGDTLINAARIEACDQADPDSGNDGDTAVVRVRGADLEITKIVNKTMPHEGDTILFTVAVKNRGPDAAAGIAIADSLPAGVSYRGHSCPGAYDPGAGIWALDDLPAGGSALLQISADVDPGTAGQVITNTAARSASAPIDPAPGNDTDSAAITVQEREPTPIAATAPAQESAALLPGTDTATVFRLELENLGDEDEMLIGLTLANTATGAGTPEQLDGDWTDLSLNWPLNPETSEFVGRTVAGFNSGRIRFSNLAIPVPAGRTVVLTMTGGASLAARDGDVLDLAVVGAIGLQFSRECDLQGAWPLDPAGAFPVDGMAAAQIALLDPQAGQPDGDLMTGSADNLVLDALLPANGYEPDRLGKINLVNWGQAQAGSDITRLALWTDDGDAVFDADADTLLGDFAFTGERWELTGLDRAVPAGGLRVFVTADIAEMASEGATVRLGFPAAPSDVALGMASDNDGPLDEDRISGTVQVISADNRVTLAAVPLDGAIVHPGQDGVLVFQCTARNSYADARRLTGLTVANASQGAGGPAELDGELALLRLYADDGNGELDGPGVDPELGTAVFVGGSAVFGGLDWDLPADSLRHLFVTADIALHDAADGDQLGLRVDAAYDLVFEDPGTAVSGAWPLDAGVRFTVDGMMADQITNFGAPVATLGPGEGPALVLDVLVPPNGYAGDMLQHLSVTNIGTAQPDDIAALHLWRDDGDGAFEGDGEDYDLGELAWLENTWQSGFFNTTLDAGGARLFVALEVAGILADSATVRLAVPQWGIVVASGNDGPVDTLVANPETQLLSSAPLLAALDIAPDGSTLGQEVTVAMAVRNVGGETVTGVEPSALAPSGTGALTLLGPPAPASFDLAAGEADTFRWLARADGTGDVVLSGRASGLGYPSGLTRLSLETGSDRHWIFTQADSLGLHLVPSMPPAVNRGQAGVVPLYFTFSNSGGEAASDVRLNGLRVELHDQVGAGIVPADLLDRVVVSEGATVYLEKTALETSGSELDLTLATPVLVTPLEPVTLSLRIDIAADTQVPLFEVVVPDSACFVTEDATSGAPVAVVLDAGAFPVASGQADVEEPPVRLDVSAGAAPDVAVSRGQADVLLQALILESPGVTGITANVRVTSFQVGLLDSAGALVADPGQVLSRLVLSGPQQDHFETVLSPGADSLLTVGLSPLATVPVNTPVTLTLSGDIAAAAPPGRYRLCLTDSLAFGAQAANTGQALPVGFAESPLAGAAIRVELPADGPLGLGLAGLPASIAVGEAGVEALRLRLRHPGPPEQAAVAVTGLGLRCRDEARNPLAPGLYLDRLRLLWDGEEAAQAADLPLTGGECELLLPAPRHLAPGDTAVLALILDVDASAPASFFELVLDGDGLHAADANTGAALVLSPEDGETLPLVSGLTRLESPARELAAGLESLMPAALATDGGELAVARLSLANTAAAGSGAISVRSLTLAAADGRGTPRPAGEVAERLRAYRGGILWAESAPLAADSVTAWLPGGADLVIEAGETEILEIRAVWTRAGEPAGGVRLGLDEGGVGVVQPGSALLAVSVLAEAGQDFPLWTETGNFSPARLADSYANFPNPFAAGRESCAFVYYLPREGRVSLVVRTARGEVVRTLVDGEIQASGLRQEATWDGRNGRGKVVANGVYLAELRVRFGDGAEERLFHKVAVLR